MSKQRTPLVRLVLVAAVSPEQPSAWSNFLRQISYKSYPDGVVSLAPTVWLSPPGMVDELLQILRPAARETATSVRTLEIDYRGGWTTRF